MHLCLNIPMLAYYIREEQLRCEVSNPGITRYGDEIYVALSSFLIRWYCFRNVALNSFLIRWYCLERRAHVKNERERERERAGSRERSVL